MPLGVDAPGLVELDAPAEFKLLVVLELPVLEGLLGADVPELVELDVPAELGLLVEPDAPAELELLLVLDALLRPALSSRKREDDESQE